MTEQKDPNGKDAHTDGAKLDAGKPRICIFFDEYFPHAIEAVTQISTFGAIKYSPGGWKSVPDGYNRYTEAMRRHYSAVCKGEMFDDETKLPHDYQIAWNALARLEIALREGKYEIETDSDIKSDAEVFFNTFTESDKKKPESFDNIMTKYNNKKASIRHENMLKPYYAQDMESRKRDALNIPDENPDIGKVIAQSVVILAENIKK